MYEKIIDKRISKRIYLQKYENKLTQNDKMAFLKPLLNFKLSTNMLMKELNLLKKSYHIIILIVNKYFSKNAIFGPMLINTFLTVSYFRTGILVWFYNLQ